MVFLRFSVAWYYRRKNKLNYIMLLCGFELTKYMSLLVNFQILLVL